MTSSEQIPSRDSATSIAWIVSLGLHFGVGVIAFFVTWTIIRAAEKPPQKVTANWHANQVTQQAALPVAHASIQEVTIELPTIELKLPLPDADGLKVMESISQGAPLPEFVKRVEEQEAKFMGLDAVAAESIVYVVDASGSMLLHLSSVVSELERSMLELHPKQSFSILFFQQDDAIQVPPRGKLQSANGSNIQAAVQWIKRSGKVIPSGSSNPIAALRSAIRLRPDVIYLLSENITGSGQYAVSAEAVLASLDRLNPIDPATGLRRVQINCIQYLTSDPSQTMQRIAAIHGGEDGYTFIMRGTVDE